MGIDYHLTLGGDISLQRVAELVGPELTADTPEFPDDLPRYSADLTEQAGYSVSVYRGQHGYCDAEDDDGSQWEWEPDVYVNVSFRMSKNDESEAGTPNMVAAVGRVLAGVTQDAALILNDNWLLLTRVDGRLRKHRPAWWNNYNLNDAIS